MKKPLFIVFEGVDGCGKSLQAKMLNAYFKKRGLKSLETAEPAFLGKNGAKLRRVLQKKEKVSSLTFQKMFVQDRKLHLSKTVNPSLKKDVSVISSRYVLSTIAYGAISEKIETLLSLNQNFPYPDFTFILKTPIETCLKRIMKRGKETEFFEKIKILKQVSRNYKLAAKNYPNVYILNGDKNPEKIHKDILKIINHESV